MAARTPGPFICSSIGQGVDHNVIPKLGIACPDPLKKNFSAVDLMLKPEVFHLLGDIIKPLAVVGGGYNATTQAEIDTEAFA